MTALEITLLLVGVIFMLGSFMIEERFSQKDIKRISELSEKELRVVVDRQLKNMEAQVDETVDNTMNQAMEIGKRAMERISNEKIMMVDEYSKTVLASMKKTHEEILFLYSMLGDKHTELTGLASELQQFPGQMRKMAEEVLDRLDEAAGEAEQRIRLSAAEAGVAELTELLPETPLQEKAQKPEKREKKEKKSAKQPVMQPENEPEKDLQELNKNEKILRLHRDGTDDVEIARQLGCGLGEVKLVIGLYEGEMAT